MQYAKCNTDNQVWEAKDFAALDEQTLESLRTNLVCVECGEFAWFRKKSKHGHPAHFCAHHADTCALKIEYTVSSEQRNDFTTNEEELNSGDNIIVHLDQEKHGKIDTVQTQSSSETQGGTESRSFSIRGSDKETTQQFTMRRILFRLVQSPDFRHSIHSITFFKSNQDVLLSGQIKNIVVNFQDIRQEFHDDKQMVYWGPIASAKKTPDGKLWLNSSLSHKNVSVVLFEDIVEKFITLFEIEDLDELTGAHVLVIGKCFFSQNGKPIIWCGSTKYIVVRRYKNATHKIPLTKP